jgi:hypothetical protein
LTPLYEIASIRQLTREITDFADYADATLLWLRTYVGRISLETVMLRCRMSAHPFAHHAIIIDPHRNGVEGVAVPTSHRLGYILIVMADPKSLQKECKMKSAKCKMEEEPLICQHTHFTVPLTTYYLFLTTYQPYGFITCPPVTFSAWPVM